MKKFITTLTLAAALTAPTFAQTERMNSPMDRKNNVSMMDRMDNEYSKDYSKMIRARYEVEMRGLVANSLDLNEEEIVKFTPIFMNYLSAKKALMENRQSLVKEYGEEMAEDDTIKDEANETADFIENYWEIDIDEMELKKDYFDRFEDIMGSKRALTLFDVEKMYSSRLQRIAMMESLPMQPDLYNLEPITYSYEREMNDYNTWNKVYINGEVALDHNYTYNGIEKLMTAMKAMVGAEGIMVNNFADRKDMIMSKVSNMKKNWKSMEHADMARLAFQETAAILGDIASDSRFTLAGNWTDKLNMKADAIKPGVKLTDQGDAVNEFFSTAQYIVNRLVDQANGASK